MSTSLSSAAPSPAHDAAGPGTTPIAHEAIELVNLKELASTRVPAVLRQLATMVHAVWGHCTDEFASPSQAEDVIRRRLEAGDEALFVALGRDDVLVGTGSIGHDDFYDGFSRSNRIDPGYVGRDLFTAKAWRGIVIDGLKVWEQLLEARLRWIAGRGGTQLSVFTEPGRVDLAAIYGRVGAVVLHRGLDHRRLGRGSITMLGYPVRRALQELAALRQKRRSAEMAPYGRQA
ncbi:MAG TPA: hypothetical protein VF169_01080 [Albitalea sp.]|uniref:hypothetical protein n=1 Tax=Piscinibacter sp. TaxID=1903157 RepID=UPI002ED4CF43